MSEQPRAVREYADVSAASTRTFAIPSPIE